MPMHRYGFYMSYDFVLIKHKICVLLVRLVWVLSEQPRFKPPLVHNFTLFLHKRRNGWVWLLKLMFRPRGRLGRTIESFFENVLSVFRPWGSLDRRVNYRYVSQPRWVGVRWSTRGNNKGNRGLVLSCAQGGCACSRGLQAFAREWEREPCASAHPPARPPSRTRALDLPFIDVRRGSRCTTGSVSMC
jgi:hypothetical protein